MAQAVGPRFESRRFGKRTAGAWRAALAPAAAALLPAGNCPLGFLGVMQRDAPYCRFSSRLAAPLPSCRARPGAPPADCLSLLAPSVLVLGRRPRSSQDAAVVRRHGVAGLQCPPSVTLGPLDRLDLRVRVAGPPMPALGDSRPSRPTRPSCTSRRPSNARPR